MLRLSRTRIIQDNALPKTCLYCSQWSPYDDEPQYGICNRHSYSTTRETSRCHFCDQDTIPIYT
jgi:hypothetical protein